MNIFWNIQDHQLVAGLTETNGVQQLKLTLRDIYSVNLYVVTPSTTGQGYTAAAAPAGFSPVFGIKVKSVAGLAGALLTPQPAWAEDTDGDANVIYTGTINLNTAELIAVVEALATDVKLYGDVYGEFTLKDASGNNRDSTPIDCRIALDVNRDTDAVPSPVAPAFEHFLDDDGQWKVRVTNYLGQTVAVLSPTGA